MQGQNEVFDRMADQKREMAETDDWAGCVLACAERSCYLRNALKTARQQPAYLAEAAIKELSRLLVSGSLAYL
jgi:hypothetical protein